MCNPVALVNPNMSSLQLLPFSFSNKHKMVPLKSGSVLESRWVLDNEGTALNTMQWTEPNLRRRNDYLVNCFPNIFRIQNSQMILKDNVWS